MFRFRSLIQRRPQKRPLDRHTLTQTHDFEPDPRWYPPKKGQRITASLLFQFSGRLPTLRSPSSGVWIIVCFPQLLAH